MRVPLIDPVLALTGLILLAGCAADPKVPTGVDTTGMPNAELVAFPRDYDSLMG